MMMKPSDQVVAKADGLHIVYDGGLAFLMPWDEVYAIAYSKVDAAGVSIVYLTFDYAWGEFAEVHDGMDGFRQLVVDLPQHLPIIVPGWQKALAAALPGEEAQIIFQRPASQDRTV